MKITKSFLEQIIKEEIEKVLKESVPGSNLSPAAWEKLPWYKKIYTPRPGPEIIGGSADITGLGAATRALRHTPQIAKGINSLVDAISGWLGKNPDKKYMPAEDMIKTLATASKKDPPLVFYHHSNKPPSRFIKGLETHEPFSHGNEYKAMWGFLPGHSQKAYTQTRSYTYEITIPPDNIIRGDRIKELGRTLPSNIDFDMSLSFGDIKRFLLNGKILENPRGTVDFDGVLTLFDYKSIKPENVKLIRKP